MPLSLLKPLWSKTAYSPTGNVKVSIPLGTLSATSTVAHFSNTFVGLKSVKCEGLSKTISGSPFSEINGSANSFPNLFLLPLPIWNYTNDKTLRFS